MEQNYEQFQNEHVAFIEETAIMKKMHIIYAVYIETGRNTCSNQEDEADNSVSTMKKKKIFSSLRSAMPCS